MCNQTSRTASHVHSSLKMNILSKFSSNILKHTKVFLEFCKFECFPFSTVFVEILNQFPNVVNNSLLACKLIFNKSKCLILSLSKCVSLSEPYLMENYTSLAEVDNIFMWKLMVIVMIHGLMDGSHSTAVMLIDSRISRTVCTIKRSILLSSNDK